MATNGLPKITIDYGNGALGQNVASRDGLLCIAVCGAKETQDFTFGQHYSLQKLSDLEDIGIDKDNNTLIYNTVRDFYTETQDGTEVYVVGYPATLKMSDVLDKNNPYLKSIIEATNGEIRGFVVTAVPETTPVVEKGLNKDVYASILNAHILGEWARTARYAPVFTILDGLNFNGNVTDLADLKQYSNFRSAVVLGSTKKDSPNQSVGLVAGKIAKSSVDKNIGRVADRPLHVLNMYLAGTRVEQANVEAIYNKSYIIFRTFTGMAGYFIADDQMATKETDDYSHLTAIRTIDKASRIAYAVLVNQILDKVEVHSDGTMVYPVVVSWQNMLENAIASNMTAAGELSADDDNGVQVYIDPQQDVLATSTVKIELRVRPFGYARYINVLLGFTVNE